MVGVSVRVVEIVTVPVTIDGLVVKVFRYCSRADLFIPMVSVPWPSVFLTIPVSEPFRVIQFTSLLAIQQNSVVSPQVYLVAHPSSTG